MNVCSKATTTSAGIVCVLGLLLVACPADNNNDACVPGASAGSSGGGGTNADSGAPPVDPCIDTPTNPTCLDESSALFVSGSASAPDADGSRTKPYKTIGEALAKVSDARKRIYVCEGTYVEKVEIRTTVAILGGLACSWKDKGVKPRIAPLPGVALSIVKTPSVAITDVVIEGTADSQVPGDSAIAAFVSESQGTLLRRVDLKAGAGRPGTHGSDGTAAPNHSGEFAAGGLSTATAAGAEAPDCGVCADGNYSIAGTGAASGLLPTKGDAKPTVGIDNSGGSGGVCIAGSIGTNGAAGAAAAGAPQPGKTGPAGWDSTSSASKGVTGNPGQGGGGGGSMGGEGGGSGGCGGCGGTGGEPGGNGGSSFALLSFESDVSIIESTLTAADGGPGGNGGKGQDGQIGGGPGGGVCSGGQGGRGAGGGGGGGGAGGHSAAIAHVGKPPITSATTLHKGAPGVQGVGGDGGGISPGAAGSPGALGSTAELLVLQ